MTVLNAGCGGMGWPWGDLWKLAKHWYNRDKNGDAGAEPAGAIGDDKGGDKPDWKDDVMDAAKDAADAVTDMLDTTLGEVAKEAGGDLINPDMSMEDALGEAIFDLAQKQPISNAFKNGLMVDFTDAAADILPSDTKLTGGLLMGMNNGLDIDLLLKATKVFNVWTPEIAGDWGGSLFCTTVNVNAFVQLGHDLTGDTGGNVGAGVGGKFNFNDFSAFQGTWADGVGVEVGVDHDFITGETTTRFGLSFGT